jgi:hypothetical protein
MMIYTTWEDDISSYVTVMIRSNKSPVLGDLVASKPVVNCKKSGALER